MFYILTCKLGTCEPHPKRGKLLSKKELEDMLDFIIDFAQPKYKLAFMFIRKKGT